MRLIRYKLGSGSLVILAPTFGRRRDMEYLNKNAIAFFRTGQIPNGDRLYITPDETPALTEFNATINAARAITGPARLEEILHLIDRAACYSPKNESAAHLEILWRLHRLQFLHRRPVKPTAINLWLAKHLISDPLPD